MPLRSQPRTGRRPHHDAAQRSREPSGPRRIRPTLSSPSSRAPSRSRRRPHQPHETPRSASQRPGQATHDRSLRFAPQTLRSPLGVPAPANHRTLTQTAVRHWARHDESYKCRLRRGFSLGWWSPPNETMGEAHDRSARTRAQPGNPCEEEKRWRFMFRSSGGISWCSPCSRRRLWEALRMPRSRVAAASTRRARPRRPGRSGSSIPHSGPRTSSATAPPRSRRSRGARPLRA